MKYEIHYDAQPKKFLKKLDKHIIKRIMDRIDDSLKENPVPRDAKAIVGEHGVFRLRIGKYRALYRINYDNNKIIIVNLDKRPRVYNL